MLRVYFLQNWYVLSDPAAEEMLYDSEAMRRFAGIDLGDDRIPDAPKGPWPRWGRVSPKDAILNFRHLLERHGLTESIFAELNAHLADKGITLRSRTLVDVSRRTPCVRVSLRKIIAAPSSTKNEAKARDPEMSSTKKGNDWYFGSEEDQKFVQWINFPTNAHIGVDAEGGVVDSLDTSTAKLHDARVWDDLLHSDDTSVWADKGYVSAEREAAFKGPGKVWGVMRKAPKCGKLDPLDERINHIIAMVRARVEHPFRVIKRQFGHVKTRYRGLARNRAQLFTLFAPGTLFLVRKRLMA